MPIVWHHWNKPGHTHTHTHIRTLFTASGCVLRLTCILPIRHGRLARVFLRLHGRGGLRVRSVRVVVGRSGLGHEARDEKKGRGGPMMSWEDTDGVGTDPSAAQNAQQPGVPAPLIGLRFSLGTRSL